MLVKILISFVSSFIIFLIIFSSFDSDLDNAINKSYYQNLEYTSEYRSIHDIKQNIKYIEEKCKKLNLSISYSEQTYTGSKINYKYNLPYCNLSNY